MIRIRGVVACLLCAVFAVAGQQDEALHSVDMETVADMA